jgi:hypothetical protein
MAEAGGQIMVFAHSFGVTVSAGAVEGLRYNERDDAWIPGGVIMVVCMAVFVTHKGQTVLDQLGGNWLPWMIIKVRTLWLYWSRLGRLNRMTDMRVVEPR